MVACAIDVDDIVHCNARVRDDWVGLISEGVC